MSTLTPNMGLPLSTIGVDSGLSWEQNLNSSETIIDGHNHSPGLGVPINPSGINISSDLPFGQNNAIDLRSVRFVPQTVPLSQTDDIGCLYEVGPELYYNDGSGNVVPLTKNGNVNSGAGSISGLPSGTASASFASGEFIFESATNTPATMDIGSVTIRDEVINGNGVTLSPINSLAADYDLILPTIPSTTQFLTIDASGNIAGTIPIANGITRNNQASVGQQRSSSCGVVTIPSSAGATNVTNLTVTITTTGRPVMLFLQPSGSALNPCQGISLVNTSGGAAVISGTISYTGGSLSSGSYFELTSSQLASGDQQMWSPSIFYYMDTPSAGTQTYQVVATALGTPTDSIKFVRMQLVAYEL